MTADQVVKEARWQERPRAEMSPGCRPALLIHSRITPTTCSTVQCSTAPQRGGEGVREAATGTFNWLTKGTFLAIHI